MLAIKEAIPAGYKFAGQKVFEGNDGKFHADTFFVNQKGELFLRGASAPGLLLPYCCFHYQDELKPSFFVRAKEYREIDEICYREGGDQVLAKHWLEEEFKPEEFEANACFARNGSEFYYDKEEE